MTVGLSRLGSTSGRGAGAELARAVGRGQRELEAVGNSLQAVVDGDAGHGVSGISAVGRARAMMLAPARALAVSKSLLIIAYSNSPAWAISSRALAMRRADHGFGVLAARAHAPLELLDRGRQDEDADAVGVEPAHLLRALPVDLEEQVVAALRARRAITCFEVP